MKGAVLNIKVFPMNVSGQCSQLCLIKIIAGAIIRGWILKHVQSGLVCEL